MKAEAARNVDDLNPTDGERALGSYDAIVAAREAERATLLERVGATLQPEPPRHPLADLFTKAGSGAGKLAALDMAEREGQRAAEEDDRAKAEAMIAPLREQGHGAITKMGLLRRDNQERVAAIAALDLKAILKRVPPQVVPGLDHAPNHFAITRYIALARDLADVFRVFTPVDFQDAIRAAEASAFHGTSSLDFQNQIRRHMPWHTQRLVGMVASVEEQLGRLDQFEAQVAADLAGVELIDAPADPKPDLLAPMQPTPRRSSDSSFCDFDPREPVTPPPGPSVTCLGGEAEGLRVNGLEGMTEKSDKVKVYGIAEGGR
jgi:hypothetical protein